MNVHCELSDDGKRIEVFYKWQPGVRDSMERIPGAVYYSANNPRNRLGVSYWTLPLELESGRALRRAFEDGLTMGPKIEAWARGVVRTRRNLGTIASAHTATLHRLPSVLPKLYEAIHLGPLGRDMSDEERAVALAGPPSYQAADVMFGAVADNPLNGNEPGTGKTIETIASIYEAALDEGPHLITAPKTALESTWKAELERWQPHRVYVSTGTKEQKQKVIDRFMEEVVHAGGAGWLILNSDQLRFREFFLACDWHEENPDGLKPTKLKKMMRDCPECVYELVSEFPELRKVKWHSVTVDEAHKLLRNPKSLTARGLHELRMIEEAKRFALTGTPMGGKIMNLWPLLSWLNPRAFRAKWRFAAQWTDVEERVISRQIDPRTGEPKTAKTPGNSLKHCPLHVGHDDENEDEGGRPDCAGCRAIEDSFYEMLAPYVIRRTKAEVLPWLPPKLPVDLWCPFGSAAHAKQYHDFNRESETVVGGETITKTGVLDEFMRLKQFSGFRHEWNGKKLVPTVDSGKLVMLRGKLEELGIWDGSSDRQCVIFSQFSEVVDLVHRWTNDNGVPTAKITGSVNKPGQRDAIQEEFQRGAIRGGTIRGLVMTTTAGGVSINLDRASDVFILDETWDPDDQTQAEDRCHRASRIHQVTCYYLRTSMTIEEYVHLVVGTKSARNMRILDLRRLIANGRSLART